MIEKTNEFRRFGGPIQLASNALSTIQAIDPKFFDKIMEYFTFTGIRDAPMKGDGIALSEVQLVTASGTTAAIQSAENPGACGVDSFVIGRTSASCYTPRAPALR